MFDLWVVKGPKLLALGSYTVKNSNIFYLHEILYHWWIRKAHCNLTSLTGPSLCLAKFLYLGAKQSRANELSL